MPKVPLKRPAVYRRLYLVNKRLIQAGEVLEQLRVGLETPGKELLYSRRLLQEVRSSICESVLESLNAIEMVELARLSKLREAEEKKLRDPDEVYIQVRSREKERRRQGLPERIKFLDD